MLSTQPPPICIAGVHVTSSSHLSLCVGMSSASHTTCTDESSLLHLSYVYPSIICPPSSPSTPQMVLPLKLYRNITLILSITYLSTYHRLQTGMRGAFGKPQGTVARVNIGQPIMSIRSKPQHQASCIEAFRRAKFKFPGRQKVAP